MGILLLFLWQGVSGVPYSSIGRSKHAEYESVCHFDVLLKLFEFWPKNKLLNYLINLSINLQKPYLLLHFSTDFNKQGLKWKNKIISKRIWSPIFEFQFRFPEIGLWNFKMMSLNNLCFDSLKTYLLLHFSTDFDKQGLKWKKMLISKFSRAGFLNFHFVFLKLDFEIS